LTKRRRRTFHRWLHVSRSMQRSTSKRPRCGPARSTSAEPPRSSGVPGGAIIDPRGNPAGACRVTTSSVAGALEAPAKIGLAGLANGKCRHTAHRAAFVLGIHEAAWRYGDLIVGFCSEPT
jgi:hypothetical protein